ncbi:hypothetical protein JI747_014820 [Chryseobacterium sp. RG1]|uniref:Uncharacterized protein n=1 Tax=Chryseobacterium tagetis TaxID=2801334 RepID=A0ABS8A384_9FLAO|nr:hypothetical protein [Chryseobacterium tagetis]MCA6068456.1 hypothetical protein [Chryseobacterium tagetis]
MEYYTYWSLLDTPSNSIKSYSVCLVLLIISIIAFFLVLKFQKNEDKKLYLVLISLFIVTSLPGYIYLRFFTPDNTKERITKLLESENLGKVEGKISNYRERLEGKQKIDSFEVNSVVFQYSENAISEFNHFGGDRSNDLYNNLNVRITYSKGDKFNEIVKIEIAK